MRARTVEQTGEEPTRDLASGQGRRMVDVNGDAATRVVASPSAGPDAIEDDVTRMMPPPPAQATARVDDKTRMMPAAARSRGQKRVFSQGALIRNRFRLEQELGHGGMGIVYIARDLRKEEAGDQDSLIAIKLLSEDFKQHPDALRLLQQETRKTQQLAHPNVVTVYDFDRDGETVYMTMEYLTGMSLADYIQAHQGTQDLESVLPIISDVVHGLQYAHERYIIHSDLKPGNVFLLEDGVAKILDLGIARAIMGNAIGDSGRVVSTGAGSTGNQTRSASRPNTQTLIALTPKYASPEMFADAPPDPRDDIYALACITYELLTGEHPFAGRPANEVKQLGLTPAAIPGLTERQWKGLLYGLSLEREGRCPSAEEFLQAFLPKGKQPWKWATLGLGIVAVAFTAYLMLRPPQETPLSQADRAVVNQELEVARQHMEVGSLGNALENYKMILALPPYDKEPPGGGFVQHSFDRVAIEDLDRLLETMQEQAQAAMEDGRWQDAAAFVDAGLDVDKDHSGLLKIAEKIKVGL